MDCAFYQVKFFGEKVIQFNSFSSQRIDSECQRLIRMYPGRQMRQVAIRVSLSGIVDVGAVKDFVTFIAVMAKKRAWPCT